MTWEPSERFWDAVTFTLTAGFFYIMATLFASAIYLANATAIGAGVNWSLFLAASSDIAVLVLVATGVLAYLREWKVVTRA